MGRAMRWFRSLLGMKKEKEQRKNSNDGDCKDKKRRWSFGKTGSHSSKAGQIPVSIPVSIPAAAEAAWVRSCYTETERVQKMHAIAVAATTAADAAIQAAFAVVRLTSHDRGTMFGGGRGRWAALKIQTFFRGYLARKALRALKGLVKFQAHVRGYLVRKQAAAILHALQALIRAQATVLSQRSARSRLLDNNDKRVQPELLPLPKSVHNRRLWASSLENAPINNLEESPKKLLWKSISVARGAKRRGVTPNCPNYMVNTQSV